MTVDPTRVEASFPDYSEPIHMGDFRVTDPTAYHRKLAENIWDASRGVNGGVPEIIESFAAALASEGVVDPEIHRQISQGLRNMQQMRDAEHTKVERLKAAMDGQHAIGFREGVLQEMKSKALEERKKR